MRKMADMSGREVLAARRVAHIVERAYMNRGAYGDLVRGQIHATLQARGVAAPLAQLAGVKLTATGLQAVARDLRDLRAARVERRAGPDPLLVPVAARMRSRLLGEAAAVIESRGVDTPAGYAPGALRLLDRGARVWLVGVDYWHDYSRRSRWHISARWVVGREDGQIWVERVPASVETVAGALEYITPAVVKRARESGRGVLRQGDVWVIERRRGGDDLGDLPARHAWDPDARTLTHPEHGALSVPWGAVSVALSRSVPTGSRVHNWD